MGAKASVPPPIHPQILQTGLWLLHADKNYFLGVTSDIFNNGIIIKTPENTLVIINPPSSDPRYIDAIKTLELAEHAPVAAIFTPGDWHHFHVPTWAAAWPEANVYVASERVLDKQPTLRHRQKVFVVQRAAPAVPELASSCTLLPWIGSQQPHWLLGGDSAGSDRVEHLILHQESRTYPTQPL